MSESKEAENVSAQCFFLTNLEVQNSLKEFTLILQPYRKSILS